MQLDCKDTEVSLSRWRGMDCWPAEQLSRQLLGSHQQALNCVSELHQSLADTGSAMTERLRQGEGRLVYGGAGSAGAQACLDGLELPCTFGWPKKRMALLLAGGLDSFYDQGGLFEDNQELAQIDLDALALGTQDVLLAVSASGSTPYTLKLLEVARAKGALTVAVVNNDNSAMQSEAEYCLLLNTGAEAVAGSTRMAAATAQKIVLNALSTLVMTQLGYLYDNLMVRMRVSNKKLQGRAVQIICQISACEPDRAQQLLQSADLDISVAVLMADGLSLEAAQNKLLKYGGKLRAALEESDSSTG